MKKLISFDLKSEMGFFKKPDINNGIYLTYNLLHKPALLGILGAIIGFSGYFENNKFPEYYQNLKDLPLGIEPTNHENGNFQKTIVKYNNGVGYASSEEGGNLIIVEQTLLKPSFRVYLLLDLENEHQHKLYSHIKNCQAEYLPYMGKNDYSAWWNKESVKEYEYKNFSFDKDFEIKTIYIKNNPLKNEKYQPKYKLGGKIESNHFAYFERLPVVFNEKLFQYELFDFVYTNWKLERESSTEGLYELHETSTVIQLF